MHHSLAGRLLVSRPELHDPNFDGTITLLLEHNEHGAFGLVLNRPTTVVCRDSLPRWSDLVSAPGVVFSGGPVQPEAAIALSRPAAGFVAVDHADSTDSVAVDGDDRGGTLPLGLVSIDLDAQPELVAPEITELRIFSGYAGWGGGQLEGELAMEAWWVTDAELDDVFSTDPSGLWAKVLRRSGGDLQWYAHLPEDPSLN